MTKEQLIKRLIEMRRAGADEALDRVCESSTGCEDCPLYSTGRLCSHQVIDDLLDHIIDNETRQETNLEHYYKGFAGYRTLEGSTTVDVMFSHDIMSMYNQDDEWDFAKWLLQPYKPKQRYMMDKLTYGIVKQWAEVNEIYRSDEAYGSDLFDILFDLGLWNDSWGNVNELDMWTFADNAEVIDE